MENRNSFKRMILTLGSPYGTLLFVLVVILLIYPFLGSHGAVSWVFDFILLAAVASAVRVTKGRGRVYYLIWVLGLSAFISSLLGRSLGIESVYPVGAGLRALFMGYLIVVIFSDTMRRRKVTFDAVLGASCVYVLLGLTFGSVFALFEWVVPGSFSIPAASQSTAGILGRPSTEFSLSYFSLIAMTTVGFGDIIPVAPLARSMAALEGMLGQLFVTIIIARLVGLEIAGRMQEQGPRDEG